ncbi:MAG TPA: hypothetical protein VLC06_13040 [Polyangia bacterium]|jgi:hypothetical protein|nr:hypothetical protein [Polyangia bacterium]
MDPESLMTEVVAAFEQILALLCNNAPEVHPAIDHDGNATVIGIVAILSPADKTSVQTTGGAGALQTLAAAIGAHNGGAVVSFLIA